MEELSACRACLATDAKLFDMYKYELISAYENLTGLQMTSQPHEICSFCAALLMKYSSFRRKCIDAQQLLSYAIVEGKLITTDYINTIDRKSHNLAFPYTTTHNVHIKQELATENNLTSLLDDIMEHNVKAEGSSDEEPLVKLIKKGKKHKKKRRVKAKENITEIIHNGNKMPIIKEELADDLLRFDVCFDNDDQYEDDDDVKPKFICDDQIEVVILSKEEQMQELQSRKTSLNYINSCYRCDLCFKGFLLEATYTNHIERHDPCFGAFSCDICFLRFPTSRTLQQHKLATHSRNYICRRCGHVCKAKSRATEHYKWHQGVLYVCDICGAAFDKPTSHLTHVRINHPSRHICPVCGVSFVSEHGLKMHGRKAHRSLENADSDVEYKCILCGVQFNCGDALARHLTQAENDTCDPTLRPCIFCGENFITEEELRKHATELHGEEKSFDCLECNKSFTNARYLAAHFRRVHATLAYKPPRSKLLADAVCEICGKKCTSKATLVYHQRTHSGEKPYQCNECPKRFSVLQRLQIHTRTHTGERPCQCPHCPKAFKHKAALNRHVRVHTGVKPYSCPHCGKCFSQSNTMKGHVRSVHLKLPSLYRRSGRRGEYSE